MKREFLQNLTVNELPLPKEVVDAIMAENGKDIENAKAPYADYQTLKTRLEEYEKLDVAALQQQLQHWKDQFTQAQQTHRQELDRLSFESAVQQAIQEAQGRNVKAISALLDLPALQACEDRDSALKKALEELKKDEQYLFGDQTPPPYARATGTRTPGNETAPTGLAGALREKFERK